MGENRKIVITFKEDPRIIKLLDILSMKLGLTRSELIRRFVWNGIQSYKGVLSQEKKVVIKQIVDVPATQKKRG